METSFALIFLDFAPYIPVPLIGILVINFL